MKLARISAFVTMLSNLGWQVSADEFMTSDALAEFPNPPADEVIAYGEDPLQFAELRLPPGDGPHPVMVLVHGGCWLAEFDIAHIRKLAAAITAEGYATWALEYRRVGNDGGGWPGTFDDVAAGTDHLASVAERFNIDLERVVVAGHSAGGHLAIWLANRPEAWPAAVQPGAVLGMAPAADLAHLQEQDTCEGVIDGLMGGSATEYPERYAQASGTERLPLGIPQFIFIGEHDEWTPAAQRYIDAAVAAGESPDIILATESGHFEMIDPDSTTWPLLRETLHTAFDTAAQHGKE